MVVIIDNYDSFTYNLVEVFRQIGIKEVKVLKNDQVSKRALEAYDHIVFSPGPALPKDSPAMWQVLDWYSKEKAILGVCLGLQAIGEWLGGKLVNLPDIRHGHQVKINVIDPENPLFRSIGSSMDVGLYHSWALDRQPLPKHCTLLAESGGVPMAIQVEQTRVFGVQFHPESYMTPMGKQLLMNFMQM
jgi:anthranilate synthase/aminodeoxychorismate synthase-like glutamine amidotransferase